METAQIAPGQGQRISRLVSDYFHTRASRTEYSGRVTADVFRELCDEWPVYFRSNTGEVWNGDPALPVASWAYRSTGIQHLVRHKSELDRPYSLMEAASQDAIPATTKDVRLVEDLAMYTRIMHGSRLHVREAKWATRCAGLLPTAPDRRSYLYCGWMRGLATIVNRYAAADRYFEAESLSVHAGDPSEAGALNGPVDGNRERRVLKRPFVDSSHMDLVESSAAIPLSFEQPWASESQMTPEALKDFVFKNLGDVSIANNVAARLREEGLTGADPLGATDRGPNTIGGPPTFEEQVLYLVGQMHNQKPLPISADFEEVSFLDPRVQRVVLSMRFDVGVGPTRDESNAPVLTGQALLEAFSRREPSDIHEKEDQDA